MPTLSFTPGSTLEHNNPVAHVHTGDPHDPTGGDTLFPWSTVANKKIRKKNTKHVDGSQSTQCALICNTGAAVIFIPSVCFSHTLCSSILLETKTPHLYTTESAAGSPAPRRVIKSSVERVGGLQCALINAYFISVPTDRRGCVAGEERETDRHLVFLNRGGMSLLWRTLWLHDMHEHTVEHWIISDWEEE